MNGTSTCKTILLRNRNKRWKGNNRSEYIDNVEGSLNLFAKASYEKNYLKKY